MEDENMSKSLEELALENRPKTYRVTVEAIGPEKIALNGGNPYVMETDGFCIISCSKDEDDESINRIIKMAIHNITPMDIAYGILNCNRGDDIMKAAAIERMKKMFEAR